MRNSQKLIFFTFLSLIISSFARLEDVSPSPSQIPVGLGGSHISISPASFASDSSPAPAPAPDPSSGDPTIGVATHDIDTSIKGWCSSTDYPDLCISAIAPSLNGKPDLFNALEITIKSAVETTKMAISAGEKIVNSPLMPSELASTLKDSLDSFADALDNFKQAQDALPLRDWGTVNTMLSGAISDFGDCEDQLSNQDVPALMNFTDKLTKMTSNCLALSSLFDPPPGY